MTVENANPDAALGSGAVKDRYKLDDLVPFEGALRTREEIGEIEFDRARRRWTYEYGR